MRPDAHTNRAVAEFPKLTNQGPYPRRWPRQTSRLWPWLLAPKNHRPCEASAHRVLLLHSDESSLPWSFLHRRCVKAQRARRVLTEIFSASRPLVLAAPTSTSAHIPHDEIAQPAQNNEMPAHRRFSLHRQELDRHNHPYSQRVRGSARMANW